MENAGLKGWMTRILTTGSRNTVSSSSSMGGGFIPSGGTPPTRGTLGYLESYDKMPWSRAIISKIGYAVASAQWRLYVTTRKREGSGRTRYYRNQRLQSSVSGVRKSLITKLMLDNEIEEIADHPLLIAIERGNNFHGGASFRKLSQIYLDLTGDCFWLKERNGVGAPVAFWPLPPQWVNRTPTQAAPVFEVTINGNRRDIPASEIVWLNEPRPSNPYGRGSGYIQSVGDELDADEYAAQMTRHVFYNRARPDLLVTPPKESPILKESEVERLEQNWVGRVQGVWKAFRPLFVSRALEVHKFDQNFANLQLRELREHQRDIVMQTFGIPPEILGVIENSNRSTIDAADYLFTRYVIEPRLELIRSQLQSKLIPDYDDRLILDYDSPVDVDRKGLLDAAKSSPWTLTVDEWRKLSGLPEKEDGSGKVHIVPVNMVSTPSLASLPHTTPTTPSQNPPAAPPNRSHQLAELSPENLAVLKKAAEITQHVEDGGVQLREM